MKKKIFAGALALVMLCCTLFMGGCGKSDGGAVSIYPVLSAESAKPGDTVTVEVYIDNAEWFCSTDFYLSYDAQYVTCVNSSAASVQDLMSELTNGSDAAGNAYIKFTGLTLTTIDMNNCKLLTAEFIVNDNAPAGEPFFGIAVDEYYKGNDKQGNETTNIVSDVTEGGVKLAVSIG